ncbi:MAG TPA: membrane protein insertion efficiency factor YidD [Eggerthellaceae bacterium]|nr:membrane protein insertion efficiency factor YidD [Eggerthellaceae bacterium]
MAVLVIRFYQFALSPHLAGCCRFEPTCSSYGLQAFQKYGFFKALKLTLSRLSRCRPGGPYGYDPLP